MSEKISFRLTQDAKAMITKNRKSLSISDYLNNLISEDDRKQRKTAAVTTNKGGLITVQMDASPPPKGIDADLLMRRRRQANGFH